VAFLPPQRAGGPAAVESAVRKADESNAIGCPTFGFRDHPGPAGLTLRTTLRATSRTSLTEIPEMRGPEETRTPIFNAVYGYGFRSAARSRDRIDM
jgi:hypothetical protein